jgi:hypothetical protein
MIHLNSFFIISLSCYLATLVILFLFLAKDNIKNENEIDWIVWSNLLEKDDIPQEDIRNKVQYWKQKCDKWSGKSLTDIWNRKHHRRHRRQFTNDTRPRQTVSNIWQIVGEMRHQVTPFETHLSFWKGLIQCRARVTTTLYKKKFVLVHSISFRL